MDPERLKIWMEAILWPAAIVVGGGLLVWYVVGYYRLIVAGTSRARSNLAMAWRMYFNRSKGS